ncbi:MAG: tRNA lysidine(34) synthetase TilS [Mycoplasmoidaceae bacterium]
MTKGIINSFLFKISSKKYIAAVSGGPDSMAMLNMFKNKIQAVAFVNYKKRIEADYEQKFVEEFCKENNIDFFAYIVDWKIEKNNINNFQANARKIRYEFFCEVSMKINNNNLLVAHNFNDFLETAYSQIEKKSKSLYYGIMQKSMYKNLKIFRPLLYVEKKYLEDYCIKNKVNYSIDHTNASDDYERNRNRKIILDMNEKDYELLVRKIEKYNKKNKVKLKKVNKFFYNWKISDYDIDFIKNIPKDLWFNIIYLLLINNDLGKISSNKINGIIDFISKNSSKEYRVTSDVNICIKNNKLSF